METKQSASHAVAEAVFAENVEPLWCGKCQRGLGVLNKNGIYHSGDKCPMCIQKGRKPEEVAILMTVSEYEADYLERAEFKKNEAKRRAPKSIKSVEQQISEATSRQESRIKELEAKLEQAIEAIPKKGRGRPVKQPVEKQEGEDA